MISDELEAPQRIPGSRPRALAEDRDRALHRRALLLHIAVACPSDANELSWRLARPHQAVHDDLETLMGEGLVHLHDGTLRTSIAPRIVAEATAAELQEIHDQVLAELASGAAARPATLVALAESGCHDEALYRLLIRAAGEHPEDAAVNGALSLVARARGESDDELRLLRAGDAAARGHAELVLTLSEELLTDAPHDVQHRAALLAAGAHIQGNRLERATALYDHVGAERIGIDGAWAVIAAVGQGDLDAARQWRAAMGDASLTSRDAGLTDFVDGLLQSLVGNGDGALDLLARAVSTLAPLGADLLLPETPASIAALVALGRGEPATAEVLLERALRADLGGETGRRRHILLTSWSRMVQGRMDAAERTLQDLDGADDFDAAQCLGDRDLLLYWCLKAGIAYRRTDLAEMRAAWREIRGHTFGLHITLYDLLPLGEMTVVAARLHDAARVQGMVASAMDVLDGLGHPISWAAPLHWHGVQAAFQSEDPAALIPHANALVAAEKTSAYAAILARAGQTWLEVLRREADFDSVEKSVRALAKTGHIWDASRLAGQAALQHPDRESALSMMQLAREISKDHARATTSAPKSSVLTARELEVGRLVLDGQGYRAIGEQLFISPKTVEHHVARIRSRLGASSRSELLAMLHDVLAGHDW